MICGFVFAESAIPSYVDLNDRTPVRYLDASGFPVVVTLAPVTFNHEYYHTCLMSLHHLTRGDCSFDAVLRQGLFGSNDLRSEGLARK